jgi:hypothetical protein
MNYPFYLNGAKTVKATITPNAGLSNQVQWEGYHTAAVATIQVYYLGDVDVINSH